MLKLLLYPNIKIYILSNVGIQAQETFIKMEDMAKQRINSIPSLKDIFIGEVDKPRNSDGFVHDRAGFRVSMYSGGTAFTLNSVPDNIRGKRANLLCFDESSFCSEELITAAMPFITQESDFKVSTDEAFDTRLLKKEVPTQVIFASSAGDIDSRHARLYKSYSIKMIAGDSDYFVADIPCDIPLKPLIDGKESPPLLSRSQIEDEMRANPDKALREYYNKFQADGGEDQIIKWAMIRRNENFILPILHNTGNDKFVMALDPARTNDNSIVSVMRLLHDEQRGYYGEIVNSVSLIDLGKRTKTPMRSPDQIKYIKNLLLAYNGDAPDYRNIERVMIDAGTGGGGISAFADNIMEDWVDDAGIVRKGLIDPDHKEYSSELSKYPNAARIITLVSPQTYKKQMVEELIELMRLDLIKFPKEYNGKPEIALTEEVKGKEVEIKYKTLSVEEQLALVNIDIMKTETTSIHRFKNPEGTNVRYALPKDKESIINDDRFDTLILLAHYLYKLRRSEQLGRRKPKRSLQDYLFHN